MIVTPIHTEHAPAAIGPYSQAVRCGDFVFLSGQIPLDPTTLVLVGDEIEKQAYRAFTNIQAVLQAANSSLAHVVQLTIYLTDLNDFSIVNHVMQQFFKVPYPARATIQVSRLPKEAKIEISAIAAVAGA